MATENGSGSDPTIDGSEPFNGNDVVAGDNVDSGPQRTDNGAIDPASLVKRGRGRPRKDGTGGTPGNDSTKSGQESGAKSGPQKSAANLDVEIFATQLMGFHMILVKLTKNPIWEISKDEAIKLAKSVKEVMALHQIKIPAKYMVYGNLFAVGMAIYGPRLAILAMQQKAASDAAKNTFNTDGTPVTP